jgi:hypothetical protein
MSQNVPFTAEQQTEVAKALLSARPPTIPGTRVVADNVSRTVWYDTVTKVADVCCRGSGQAQDAIDAARFFDNAGVPD